MILEQTKIKFSLTREEDLVLFEWLASLGEKKSLRRTARPSRAFFGNSKDTSKVI